MCVCVCVCVRACALDPVSSLDNSANWLGSSKMDGDRDSSWRPPRIAREGRGGVEVKRGRKGEDVCGRYVTPGRIPWCGFDVITFTGNMRDLNNTILGLLSTLASPLSHFPGTFVPRC
ncbi:hypothetical protein PoB_007095800 [Plakobranchus ocellatus]|uniref:Secreted protein n=1 Tax=Plakobranchus ocellatus TaxID=259542 RepID=A0AAV4DK54_9GAST|nr:hypothetical protein PoB_007095800 [Plakobranchus ocellatus]